MNNKSIFNDDCEYKSYFHTYETKYDDDIAGLTTISNHHKRYISEMFTDDPIICKVQRKQYINSVNNWLLSPLYKCDEYDDCDDDYDDEHDENKECENNITNQTVGKKMYDEILNTLHKSGFEINDHKQFKEDLIHFIYTLSEIN